VKLFESTAAFEFAARRTRGETVSVDRAALAVAAGAVDDALAAAVAVRTAAERTRAGRAASPRDALPADRADDADDAEPSLGVLSAEATPAPASAAPMPNVSAPTPSHAYGSRTLRAAPISFPALLSVSD